MASGNFIIGESLSMQGFDKYIQPVFEEKGIIVPDKLSVSRGRNNDGILTSIVGEGDLEKTLNDSLVEIGEELDKLQRDAHGSGLIAYKHQISAYTGEDNSYEGKYKVKGKYSENETASKLFPSIAQEYLLENVENKADEVTKKIKSMMGKKISEF